MKRINRRCFVAGSSALGFTAAMPAIVSAAPEFKFKFANIMPVDHPLNTRMVEASDRVKQLTDGRVDIQVFPASQLGTDADMLSQLRSGAIDFFAQTGLIVATLVPVASITGVGFAFSNYQQVWNAVDGKLGLHIVDAFAKANLVAFDKMWDNGFRQTTSAARPIKAPDDLKGFKIRVPPSALWTSLFKSLGASPTGRDVLGSANPRGGRTRESFSRDLLRKDVRGAEVSIAHEPHVGRLLVPREPEEF